MIVDLYHLAGKSFVARENRICLKQRPNSSFMGVGGTAASLVRWGGTLTGREVAVRKSVTRLRRTISLSELPHSSRELQLLRRELAVLPLSSASPRPHTAIGLEPPAAVRRLTLYTLTNQIWFDSVDYPGMTAVS